MLSKPPEGMMSDRIAYAQWIVDQFAQRCREAAAAEGGKQKTEGEALGLLPFAPLGAASSD